MACFESAAQSGHGDAEYMVGVMYEHGYEVQTDLDAAVNWYLRGCDHSSGRAAYGMANLHAQQQRYEEAATYLQLAVERGFDQANGLLGYYYNHGIGVEQDPAKGVECYRQLAQRGDANAFYNLATCYLNGTGVEKDLEAAELLLLSASDGGDIDADSLLGELYSSGQIDSANPHVKAIPHIQRVADDGHAPSQAWVGEILTMGWLPAGDMAKGIEYLDRAIEQGNARAKYVKAVILAEGKGCDQDKEAAKSLAQAAADAGEASAQRLLDQLNP